MSLLGPTLEAFAAIVRTKTVIAASKELGITQTGVTQRIRALETQLDTTLFTRSRKGMLLTHEGEALLRYCQNARDLEGETLAQIKGAGTETEVHVKIVGPTSIMRARVIPACLPVLQSYSMLIATFEISDSRIGAESLKSGDAQFALISPEDVALEMDSKVLRHEKYVLLGHKEWKRRPIQEVISHERIIDFNSTDTMTHKYLKKFKLISHSRSERHFVNSNESLIEMMNLKLGYGVLTLEFAEHYLKNNPLTILNSGNFLESGIALAWYPRPRASSYFKDIIRAIH